MVVVGFVGAFRGGRRAAARAAVAGTAGSVAVVMAAAAVGVGADAGGAHCGGGFCEGGRVSDDYIGERREYVFLRCLGSDSVDLIPSSPSFEKSPSLRPMYCIRPSRVDSSTPGSQNLLCLPPTPEPSTMQSPTVRIADQVQANPSSAESPRFLVLKSAEPVLHVPNATLQEVFLSIATKD